MEDLNLLRKETADKVLDAITTRQNEESIRYLGGYAGFYAGNHYVVDEIDENDDDPLSQLWLMGYYDAKGDWEARNGS